MTANTEILYWQENEDWYAYDRQTETVYLTDKATDRARKSFKIWIELNNSKRKKKIPKDKLNLGIDFYSMSANLDLLYWKENDEWYTYDEETNTFSLTDKASNRAKRSFVLWTEFCKNRKK